MKHVHIDIDFDVHADISKGYISGVIRREFLAMLMLPQGYNRSHLRVKTTFSDK